MSVEKACTQLKERLCAIAAEELGHMEMVAQTIHLLNGHDVDAAAVPAGEILTHVLLGLNPGLINASGYSWTGDYVTVTGDLCADLLSNIASEQRAKVVYEYLYRQIDDKKVRETIDFLLNREEALKATERFRKWYEIKLASPDMPAEQLSGGNLQKVILARELARDPRALVCVNPTRGLDVGAIENVHSSILETRKYGTGVLLISTEMEEILSLSDRIAVMFEGRIMGVLENREDLDMDKLGLMMAGAEAN